MSALLAAAFVFGSPVADTLSPYRGQPIFEIRMDAPAEENTEDLLELTDLEPGYLLTTDALHSAVKRLYSLGRFSSVEVYARRKSGTISLRFVLVAIERLAELDIQGLEFADEQDLRDALRFRRGSEIDSETSSAVAARAVAHLTRVGFPDATAELSVDPSAGSSARDATLRVVEGRPVRVESVRFTGDVKVLPEVLRLALSTAQGGILNDRALTEDRESLVALYRERGFLTAEVSEAVVERDGYAATVTFAVRAGPRVSFHLVGNRVFSDAELMRFAPDRDVALDDNEVQDFADRISRAYTRMGRFTTEVRVEGYRDPRDGSARYRIAIREGPPMEVVSIEVEGSIAIESETIAAQIQAQLRSQLGDIGVLDRLVDTDRCLLNNQGPCRAREVPPDKRWVPSIYAATLERVAASYQNLGYLTVKVGTPEIDVDGTSVRVRITVTEGIQTFIRSLAYEGNEQFESAELLLETYESTAGKPAQAPIQPGAPFSRNGIEDARIGMTRAYRDRGYLYGRVFSNVSYSDDRQWADIAYRFDEGPQVRINRVLIRGNRYTNEAVILSRISLERGDIYRLEQALTDQRSIAELGVFSSVRVRLIDEERPSELKDLVAEVVERNRQPIEVAPGISTAEGPRLQASYSNINLFGTAGQLTLLARVNRQVFFDLYDEFSASIRRRFDDFSTVDQFERVLQAGFRSPRYVNLFWEPTFRTEVVHERSITLSYAFNSTRLVAGVDFQPTNRLRLSIAPEISLTDLTCADVDLGRFNCLGTAQGNNPNLVALDEGERRAVQVGPSVVYDGRDNPFFPTSGFLVSGSAVYSTGRSRETDTDDFDPQAFIRAEATFTRYIPLGRTVLALSARGGHIEAIQNDVPIYERFFLGGRTSLRGFPERALIAEDCRIVDSATASAADPDECVIPSTGAPITQGGKNYFLLKGELRVPLNAASSVGLFSDAGNLFFNYPGIDDIALRVSVGAGLRINTPVGPLALDLGVNTNPRTENGEDTWQPHFSVGVF